MKVFFFQLNWLVVLGTTQSHSHGKRVLLALAVQLSQTYAVELSKFSFDFTEKKLWCRFCQKRMEPHTLFFIVFDLKHWVSLALLDKKKNQERKQQILKMHISNIAANTVLRRCILYFKYWKIELHIYKIVLLRGWKWNCAQTNGQKFYQLYIIDHASNGIGTIQIKNYFIYFY